MGVESRWSVTDEAQTGARWGLLFDIDPDGRGATVSRDLTWTDLTNALMGSAAVGFTSRADNGASVNTGAPWEALGTPARFDWPAYGREVDLRLYGRTSGVWGRSAGVPAGQPQGITGGTEAARFEVGENGYLRPLSFAQTDWLVEDRPAVQPAEPGLRYTTVAAVEQMLKAPTNREAATWQSGEYDHRIEQAIRMAEGQVDSRCGRRFDPAGPAATRRVYRRWQWERLLTDDYVGDPTLTIGGETVAGGWVRHPVCRQHPSVYSGVRFRPSGRSFDTGRTSWSSSGLEWGSPATAADLPAVTVTARWGWDRVPDAVSWAAALLAVKYFRRPEVAALGIVESGVLSGAYTPMFDPDVDRALRPFTRLTAAQAGVVSAGG